MAKYVLAYRGGGMAETEAAQQEAMAAWGAWFGALGSALNDGGAVDVYEAIDIGM